MIIDEKEKHVSGRCKKQDFTEQKQKQYQLQQEEQTTED